MKVDGNMAAVAWGRGGWQYGSSSMGEGWMVLHRHREKGTDGNMVTVTREGGWQYSTAIPKEESTQLQTSMAN